MKANKSITDSIGSGIPAAFSKSLKEASAAVEVMKASVAIPESIGSGIPAAFSKSLEEASALGSESMEAIRAVTESLESGKAPAFSNSLEEALSKKAPQPLSLMLGEGFSQSLAPLVDSQSRLSEMMIQSLGLPELGFVISQNNALIASAIEDIQAVYSTPRIRVQGIESVVYPGILRDIQEINSSYRTLLSENAAIAAASENVTEMQRTLSRMLNPSSAVSNYTHSLRSEVVVKPDTEIESIPPSSHREYPQESLSLLLNGLNPDLVNKWQGSWQALEGTNPDRLSQAAFSFRELIRMALDELVPDVEVDRSEQGSKRRRQIRQVLRGSEADFACVLDEVLPKLYDFLNKPAHTSYRNEVAVRAALLAGDSFLLLLLSSKEDCDA